MENENRIQDLEESLSDLESEYKFRGERIAELKKELDETETAFDKAAEERDELKNDLDSLRSDIRELLQYITVSDGPAFEGRDALERIKEVI